ncbi:hypothetical protein BKA66DRAFT_472821 [Pyrenochaeta sp. MPI-SDFR-AT-0127]|nr:hypothetical protein BKA66DRAFT_472821 [Pyrenochaeta sp. MPI-SDFR-AT-0127]
MHCFVTQRRGEQDTRHSLREKHYRRKRGTARHQDDVPPASPEARVKTRPGDELAVPPAPFPHAPVPISGPGHAPARAHEVMARSPSRLYALHATASGASTSERHETHALKKAHLNLVSTVMHRCLLEGDYERAGRAWGIILRSQVAGGRPVDVRNHGRWGVSAEILLRRNPLSGQTRPQHDASWKSGGELFSEKGFELAKEYYERMIVQHPNRRTHPHAVDERFFYPAMFSFWIFETCQMSKRARERARDEADLRLHSSRSTSADSLPSSPSDDSRANGDTIRVEELARAMEIAERLGQLIASPPFDKEPSLLQLRGNVSLWISNLVIGHDSVHELWDMDPMIRDVENNPAPTAEQLNQLASCHRELQQAHSCFQRAAANGFKGQAATLLSIEIRLEELAQQLERWRAPRQDHFNPFASDHFIPESLLKYTEQ